MNVADDLCQRRHIHFTMPTACAWRHFAGRHHAARRRLRVLLGDWLGIGRINLKDD